MSDAPNQSLSPEQFRDAALREIDALYRLAHHLNPSDADDLVQETYLRALKAAERFSLGPRGIKPWLMKILSNVFRNRCRDGARLRLVGEWTFEPSDKQADAERYSHVRLADLDWEQVDERLAGAVRALPEDLRLIFLLFAVEDLKYREIAEMLGIPIGTVMSRLSRARRILLDQLQPAHRKTVRGGVAGE